MARLYANENFPLPVVQELHQVGHDVLTVLEAGNAGQRIPDDEVLAFAVDQKRAVLTLNRRHFIRLHASRPAHSGVIACSFDPDFTALAQRIDFAIASIDDLEKRLIRVNRPPN